MTALEALAGIYGERLWVLDGEARELLVRDLIGLYTDEAVPTMEEAARTLHERIGGALESYCRTLVAGKRWRERHG
jgi:hypothetical protein